MTDFRDVVTVDFETEGIGPRPNEYPPKPVSVAIRWANGREDFLAWGHPYGNNCDFDYARRAVWSAWQHPVLFHNAAFDMEVAWRWMGFPMPREWHDTYFLLFLCYPHADTYSLKPTASWLLSEPPAEQDAVRDWILANVQGATKKNFGAHISKAPPSIVGPYAIGDVSRTFGIFRLLWPHVRSTQFTPYDRERRLLPVLVDASRRGIRVDRTLLRMWEGMLPRVINDCDLAIRSILADPALNVDANEDLADAIERAGFLRPAGWLRTDTGRRSTAKDALAECVQHPELVKLLRYRNTQATMLRTFVRGWLDASTVDGRLHCQWHQTRNDDGGARTGRVSSSGPNLANVPNPQDKVVVPPGMPAIPRMREALLPEDGHTWVSADYSSQELRILAHYEDGSMLDAYRHNPDLDLHQFARDLIETKTAINIDRKATKTVGFAQLYGAGVYKLSQQLKTDEATARTLRDAYFDALPGVSKVKDAATRRWESSQPIVTWGGRRVPPQPPAYVNGEYRTFGYKALNMLIQGSAADQTKEAIIRFNDAARGNGMLFLSQLYDEINVSVPTENVDFGVSVLTDAMLNMPGWDVPFRADVEVGPAWGAMTPYTKKENA